MNDRLLSGEAGGGKSMQFLNETKDSSESRESGSAAYSMFIPFQSLQWKIDQDTGAISFYYANPDSSIPEQYPVIFWCPELPPQTLRIRITGNPTKYFEEVKATYTGLQRPDECYGRILVSRLGHGRRLVLTIFQSFTAEGATIMGS